MKSLKKRIFVALFATVPLFTTSCVTVSSVDGIPTNTREQKAIREASTVGAVAGAAIVGAGAAIITSNRGGSDAQTVLAGLGGALIGANVGGGLGENAGRKRVVDHRTAANQYAKMKNLASAARAYNRDVSAYNSRLRSRVYEVQRSKSKSEARSEISAAQMQYNKVNSVISRRESQSKKLPSSGSYKSTISDLKRQRASIKSSIDKLKKVERSVG